MKRLTIDYIKNNIGKEIQFYEYPDDCNSEDDEKYFSKIKPSKFMPNGDLIHKGHVSQQSYKNNCTPINPPNVYKNWIDNPTQFEPQKGDILFLKGEHLRKKNAYCTLQVCDPVIIDGKLTRPLSTNCGNVLCFLKDN